MFKIYIYIIKRIFYMKWNTNIWYIFYRHTSIIFLLNSRLVYIKKQKIFLYTLFHFFLLSWHLALLCLIMHFMSISKSRSLNFIFMYAFKLYACIYNIIISYDISHSYINISIKRVFYFMPIPFYINIFLHFSKNTLSTL